MGGASANGCGGPVPPYPCPFMTDRPGLTKAEARALGLAARRGLDKQARAVANAALAHAITRVLGAPPKAGAILAAYAAMPGEADPSAPLPALAQAGWRVALPVVEAADQPLTFRAWVPGQALREGLKGNREPHADSALLVPDVVLVPLAAFDRHGGRVGLGAGFYDRTLLELRVQNLGVRALGVAFAVQEVAPRVPMDQHDQRLDGIITDQDVHLLVR